MYVKYRLVRRNIYLGGYKNQCVPNSQNAMAESPQTFESMKDISQTLELETETINHISQEENEEEKERDPNYYEERFRVDRRKLEQMIQG